VTGVCPKCGSTELESIPSEKGVQVKCKKCGFVGCAMPADFG
jgi:predicted RNA-binding Zn-ribbon protein involved in translation (DUF1610 family)